MHKVVGFLVGNTLGSSRAVELSSGESCGLFDDREPVAATDNDGLSVHDAVTTGFMLGYTTLLNGLGSP